MCGIYGECRFDNSQPSFEQAEKALDKIAPRGPDDQGLFAYDSVLLGHRRLRIVDLSERALQPMIDSQLGLVTIFNGMIYNYRDLREELENVGYQFFSSSDTEIIPKGYHYWGMDFVNRLNGMFAFCIWERDGGRIILGRDRLGIKPLYFSADQKRIRFSSFLPALLTEAELDTSINPLALHNYLSFHSVVPAPHTILNGIHKLPAASLMTIESNGTRKFHKYWDLSYPDEPDPHSDPQIWKERVAEALKRSVKRRMIADVPVGVLLSGGVDSSLIVGLLAQEGQKDLNTFSIGFEAVGGEAGDEFRYSDRIAAEFGTTHHKISISKERLLPNLPGCVRAMSEPMINNDNIGFYLLAEEVSKHLKVVQSGQGADELFGGYFWYPPLMHSRNAVEDYSREFFDRDHREYLQVVTSSFATEDFSRAFVSEHFGQPGATSAINKALRIDSLVMLIEDPVKRVDCMTMAWGLEGRVPFLDHEVVELAAQIPAELKVGREGKFILREVAREIVPHEVIDRPKGYFPVPALKFLRGDFLNLAKDLLLSKKCSQRGIYNSDYLDSLLKAPEEHFTPLKESKLWQLTMLEFWLQENAL